MGRVPTAARQWLPGRQNFPAGAKSAKGQRFSAGIDLSPFKVLLRVGQHLGNIKGSYSQGSFPYARKFRLMKISGTGPIRRTSESGRPKKKGAGKGADFATELDEAAADKTSAVSGTGPLAAVDALLSVQEVTDSTKGRTRGAVRAQFMIDGLDEIRQGLLIGAIPKSKLAALVEVVR